MPAKYTPAGTLVRIAAEASGDELRRHGQRRRPGRTAGQREAIFEKFTRGSRESATPGVGLGLAISRAIVEAHRGRIWVEDNAGARGPILLYSCRSARRPKCRRPKSLVTGRGMTA